MGDHSTNPPATQGSAKAGPIDAFLDKARNLSASASRGRLIFALDATMSRQPTWDMAQSIQGEMFRTTAAQGGLDVQLVYFRGLGECRASRFVSGGEGLGALMSRISCRGGRTQIGKVLRHALDESRAGRIGALVYIGDAMEERVDSLAAAAGELGLLGVKAFMFQEGQDPAAQHAYREIARLTSGAYAAFDATAPKRLAELLAAAAAYAVGGRLELERRAGEGEGAARLLLSQIG
ncbi:MAG TPA: VWA domain-containing protein [Methylocystis sp.]